MSLFEAVPIFALDPILGLVSIFNEDGRQHKVNLLIGEYFDKTKVFNGQQSIKIAEQKLLEEETSKAYLSIDGDAEYLQEYKKIVFDPDVNLDLIYGCQTLGGTGSLSLAALVFASLGLSRNVYISREMWSNHKRIFAQQGLNICLLPYLDKNTKDLDLSGFLHTLKQAAKHSLVLLQGCCHNPTGIDPTRENWKEILSIVKEKELICCFDLAYQGFGDSLADDRWGVNLFIKNLPLVFVSTCNSKNFSLYGERIGALYVSVDKKNDFLKVQSLIKERVRGLISSPPRRGALIVHKILSDVTLQSMWREENTLMRNRLNSIRLSFVKSLQEVLDESCNFLLKQKGFFSYLNFSSEQVLFLREKLAIYTTNGGRLNLAGINSENLDYIVNSVKTAYAL